MFSFLGESNLFIYLFFGEGGGTNERPGTDHVTKGPMRGLQKLQLMPQTDTEKDIWTWRLYAESAQWGRFSENHIIVSSWPDPG